MTDLTSLAFTGRNALTGMDAAPFLVARNGHRCHCRSRDVAKPRCIGSICHRCRSPQPDAGCPRGHVFLSRTDRGKPRRRITTCLHSLLKCSRQIEFVPRWFGTGSALSHNSVARSIGVACGSLVAWRGFFQPAIGGGVPLIERQQRRESVSVGGRLLEVCLALQQRLGVDRVIRFCECTWLQAPAVIGWFRPVVLLPITALTGLSESQLESVIAHELAHIKRLDAFVNVFQISVETLLFYHPAIWWLNQRIRTEREHCCDDMAIALCGNAVEYARALTLMEEWRSAPILAMAANRGPLSGRIIRLLGLNHVRSTSRRVGLTGSLLCLAAALVAGKALLRIASPKPTVHANVNWLGSIGIDNPAAMKQAQPAERPAPAAKPSPAQTSRTLEAEPGSHSYIDGLQSAGLKDLTADVLIALKIQGITPDYVRQIHDLGLHPGADGFVAMKVQGVTPEYIRDLRSPGFNPDEKRIIALKVQGVSGDYVRGMKEAGIQGDADHFIALKVQGVTPDYVHDLRAAGVAVDSEDVIAMKVQGVTPAYVQGLHDQGVEPKSRSHCGHACSRCNPGIHSRYPRPWT